MLRRHMARQERQARSKEQHLHSSTTTPNPKNTNECQTVMCKPGMNRCRLSEFPTLDIGHSATAGVGKTRWDHGWKVKFIAHMTEAQLI